MVITVNRPSWSPVVKGEGREPVSTLRAEKGRTTAQPIQAADAHHEESGSVDGKVGGLAKPKKVKGGVAFEQKNSIAEVWGWGSKQHV